ncbi:hypothetical protein GQ44DRAFT_704664 [Phaeosphaeriaceae sp. PMI808]|nr:hypothetical protein GQ44DRAFT_704664 [Phaeosphaeriaceae sp. PMI808]
MITMHHQTRLRRLCIHESTPAGQAVAPRCAQPKRPPLGHSAVGNQSAISNKD